ncbi:hypothetical protein SAMN05216276_1003205 [Streptosporangium subroseum]|uniref:DUF7144 domain-containing protein n=1 Tax=Streptosporangium subroseum TaxID=106412 RepID=A0A239BGA0_9ACTN|nr:hypothetical protein [Streptosporangium subroseum]SNS07095.1 hypothetical protein SAMN05216276_1003205 [Streptosporangium subroseum]
MVHNEGTGRVPGDGTGRIPGEGTGMLHDEGTERVHGESGMLRNEGTGVTRGMRDTRTTSTGAPRITGWVGWVWFAALMMILTGAFNIIYGLVAILRSTFFLETPNNTLLFNLSAWGWIHLILGILLVVAGFAVIAGQTWARAVAVILAMVNAVTQMLLFSAYPWWSLLAIAIDVLVIYALIVHGRESEEVRL